MAVNRGVKLSAAVVLDVAHLSFDWIDRMFAASLSHQAHQWIWYGALTVLLLITSRMIVGALPRIYVAAFNGHFGSALWLIRMRKALNACLVRFLERSRDRLDAAEADVLERRKAALSRLDRHGGGGGGVPALVTEPQQLTTSPDPMLSAQPSLPRNIHIQRLVVRLAEIEAVDAVAAPDLNPEHADDRDTEPWIE